LGSVERLRSSIVDLEAGNDPGYSWEGTLGQLDARAVCARCADLRLSGLLELFDGGGRTAQLAFVGGEPVVGNPSEVNGWKSGSFRVVQRVPNLAGTLTHGVRLQGELLDVPARDLIRHCEDSRLTADLELVRPGDHVRVRFAHGRVESAEVNGKPELAALGIVRNWSDGSYAIALRPLFSDDAPPTPPPQLRSGPAPGQLFDFTAPVPLGDLPVLEEVVGPQAVAGAAVSFADAPDRSTEVGPIPGESTAITKPLPPPSKPAPVRREPAGDPDATAHTLLPEGRRRRGRWPLVAVSAAVVVLAVGAAVVLVGPKMGLFGKPGPTAPKEKAEAAQPKAVAAAPEKKAADKKPEKGKPAKREEEQERSPQVTKLIEKGRKLLVEGHSHSAADAFKAAKKQAPKDELIDTLQQMASGKTG
jgi:hypothetical protein